MRDVMTVALAPHELSSSGGTSGSGSSAAVASVDALGRATLHRISVADAAWDSSSSGSSDPADDRAAEGGRAKRLKSEAADGAAASAHGDLGAAPGLDLACLRRAAPSEWGWAGAAFRPWSSGSSSPDTLALCHQLSRQWALADATTGAGVRTWATTQPPRAICWASPDLVCLAERGTVTLWDARASSAACCARAQPSSQGLLHCLTALGPGSGASSHGSSDNNSGLAIACAGDDRIIYVLDPRMNLKVTQRWRAPCKYDVTSLHAATSAAMSSFASASPDAPTDETNSVWGVNDNVKVMSGGCVVYSSGMDNELLTCRLNPDHRDPSQAVGNHQRARSKIKQGNNNNDKQAGAQGNNNGGGPAISAGAPAAQAALAQGEAVGGHGRLHQAHRLGVRGDARWLGVAHVHARNGGREGSGALLGLCASGTLCVLTNPQAARHAVA